LILVAVVLSSCGRAYYKTTDIDYDKCPDKLLVKPAAINPDKYIRGSEAVAIVTAYRSCLHEVETVNAKNRNAAEQNRPDGFWEDVQEFLSGLGIGALLGAALVL
jgi:hypothetical protein